MKFIQNYAETIRQLEFYLQQTNYLSDEDQTHYWQHAWAVQKQLLHSRVSPTPDAAPDQITYIGFRKVLAFMQKITSPKAALEELRRVTSVKEGYNSNLDAIISTANRVVRQNPYKIMKDQLSQVTVSFKDEPAFEPSKPLQLTDEEKRIRTEDLLQYLYDMGIIDPKTADWDW